MYLNKNNKIKGNNKLINYKRISNLKKLNYKINRNNFQKFSYNK